MEYAGIYLLLAGIFGFLMAWGVGANDVANAMGTSVGSKAVTLKQAIVIAMIFEFLGSFLAGGQVTDTIRQGIIDPSILESTPDIFVLGMMSALLAAGVWLGIASYFGWPVSTSHSIVGALVGFGAFNIGMSAVKWENIGYIASSWVLSPLLGGIIAYIFYTSVQKLILAKTKPLERAKRVVPFYIFFVGWIVSLLTLVSGVEHLGVEISNTMGFLLSFVVGFVAMIIGYFMLRKIKTQENQTRRFHFAAVEKVFGVLMIFTACAMAFAHGSNDVANAIGPLSAIASVTTTGSLTETTPIPIWVLILGSVGIVTGLVTYGHKVIATIGTGITELTPTRGFAATLAAATTVVLASGTGLPISTTHTLVGAVLGVGLAKGINALNLSAVRVIFLTWIVTLPVGALLAIIFFRALKVIFI
jgi:inorganic phosphate transporter, PiT family